jgi:Ca-activated chloride channel family protein
MKEQPQKRQKAQRGVLVLVPFVLFVVASFSSTLAAQTLKVDVNLVNVFATVQNERGEFVTELNRDDFRIYEDDRLQDIQVFEKQDQVDSSLGILMDTSGSMIDILPFMKKGVRDFAQILVKPDEFFVVSFGTNVNLIHTSSQSQKHLETGMESMRAYGTSLMYDALLYSLEKIETSALPRKALVVFTDGHDNGSKVGHGRVVEEVQRSAALLYFVAIGSRILVDTNTLESLSEISGGRTFYVAKQEAVPPVLDQIHVELAHQYYLGYYAPRRAGFHRIRVEVPGRSVKIRAKTGYAGE